MQPCFSPLRSALFGAAIAACFDVTSARAVDAGICREVERRYALIKSEITSVQLGKSTTEFPVTVDLDSDVDATLPFDLGSKTLPAETKTKLCAEAGVVVRGTIQDSLLGGATPFFSPIVHPTGCL